MSSPQTVRQAREELTPAFGVSDRERLGWIVQLYRIALGRLPDAGGLQAHFEHLRRGAPLAAIAREFLESSEFRSRTWASPPGLFDLYTAAYGAEATRDVAQRLGDKLRPIEGLPERLATLIVSVPFLPGDQRTAGQVPNDDAGYQLWIAWNAGGIAYATENRKSGGPLISVLVLPEDGTKGLRQTIASILGRGQDNVELLVIGAPSLQLLWIWLRTRMAGLNVRLMLGTPFSSAALSMQRALDQCRGAYVGVMAPGDRLHPGALARIAEAVQAPVPPDLIYVDEDLIGADGVRRAPWFKTDWDPDAAQAADTIGRGWFANASLLRQAGEASSLAAKRWAADLGRDVTRRARHDRIAHLAEILYHRGEPSTPITPVEIRGPNPAVWPMVSIIVPTRDRADLLKTCITGLLEQTDYPSLDIIIVDNDSHETETQTVLTSLAEDARVRVLSYPGQFNWGAINNFAVASAAGEVILLLNNDTQVIEPGWLKEMVSQAMRPEVGVVGATLLYPDRTLQHAGIAFGPGASAGHVGRGLPADAAGPGGRLTVVRAASAVTGACLAIRREVFDVLGGIEAVGLSVTWSDSDLCLKAWAAGYRVLVTPFARLVHVELATRGGDTTPEAAARFAAEKAWMRYRWGHRLEVDPWFSPHLDAETGDLRLLNAPP